MPQLVPQLGLLELRQELLVRYVCHKLLNHWLTSVLEGSWFSSFGRTGVLYSLIPLVGDLVIGQPSISASPTPDTFLGHNLLG